MDGCMAVGTQSDEEGILKLGMRSAPRLRPVRLGAGSPAPPSSISWDV